MASKSRPTKSHRQAPNLQGNWILERSLRSWTDGQDSSRLDERFPEGVSTAVDGTGSYAGVPHSHGLLGEMDFLLWVEVRAVKLLSFYFLGCTCVRASERVLSLVFLP